MLFSFNKSFKIEQKEHKLLTGIKIKYIDESFENFQVIFQFLQSHVKILQRTLFFHQSFRK